MDTMNYRKEIFPNDEEVTLSILMDMYSSKQSTNNDETHKNNLAQTKN